MAGAAKRADSRSTSKMVPEQKELKVRARWLLQWMRRNPSMRFADQKAAVREHFGCSIATAERTIRLASEMIDEQLASIDLSWVVDQYVVQLNEARAAKKHNAVRAILDSIARVTGVEKPQKIDLQHSGKLDVRAIAHLNILKLTPAQRDNRERELEAKAARAIAAPVIIDVTHDESDE